MSEALKSHLVAVVARGGAPRSEARASFEEAGYRVHELDADAVDALEEPVSLVWLDIGAEGAAGLDALPRLRGRGIDAPVIVVSDRASPELAHEAARRGAYEACARPTERSCAVRLVARAIEHAWLAARVRRLERELDAHENVLSLRELERRAIEKALVRTKGSVEKAARLLGIGRATLYRRLGEEGFALRGQTG
jgi:DNA-binding NtrC family response regulator